MADTKNRRAVMDKHRFNADILIMQETHSTPECESIWEAEWGGKVIFTHGTTQAKGVAVFFKRGLFSHVENIFRDCEGRVVVFDWVENEHVVTIVALYAPNQDTPSFFEKISEMLKGRSEHKIVIGDFNLTLDVDLDRENTYSNNSRSKEKVEEMMEQYFMEDIWRVQHGEKREFSWRKGNTSPPKASRIDFALVSKGIDQKVEITQYLTSVFTDHRALYMCIDLQQSERGCGYWKLNNSLLRNENYIMEMNHEIELTLRGTDSLNPIEQWEKLKERIKKKTVQFSRRKNSQEKLILSQLCEIVDEYESRLPLTQEEDKILEDTKADLEEKTLERIKGVMFRSKARWYEEGEQNTKYFYSLEKSRYNAKTCYKMINEEGKELSHNKEILEEQKTFYTKLYSVDKDVNFTMVNDYGIKVSEENKIIQNQPICMEELEVAIKGMKNDKTPGNDGIPVDFYKVFWRQIKEVYYNMVVHTYQQGILHQSARQGVLNLIPKPGKDSRYIKNLRPITLLNTDYKIIEKTIANKMIPALVEIIHTDQRGFMKDRRISVNIRKMLDIMHYAEKEDLEAVVLSLDFVKCFDKCSFTILFGSLDFFGFGEVVKKWTEILYKDFSVKIQNNGHFSDSISIQKGVHQGGCCSSVYFLVIAEILALSLRKNENIEGITIREIRNLLNQFADDMDICSICNKRSLKAIFEELDKFRLQSGFTVSYDKTTLYRIGSLRHSDAQKYGMDQYAWSNKDISVLGVTISHEDIVEKNFESIVEKTKRVLNAWYNRNLSLIGKIQIVNTLVASLYVYKMMVLPTMTKNMFKKIDNIIREYIWAGKKSKIAFSILQNSKYEAGLNLVNLQRKDIALKSTWPQILHQEAEYSKIVYSIMKVTPLDDNIWRCNLDPKDIGKIKLGSKFWEDTLRSWCEYNYYGTKREENQIIWFNSMIKIGGKPIFWKDVYNRGLVYIHQLFEECTFKTELQVFNEFGLTVLRYNSLKTAISRQWINFFETTPKCVFCPIPPHAYDECIYICKYGWSKKVYKFLSDDVMVVHNKYVKWCQDLGSNFCEGVRHFGDLHQDIYRVTNVPKYRSFQYRLLQRGLVTNIQLYKWGIISSELCFFCSQEKESVMHMLVQCIVIQNIWVEFESYIRQRFNIMCECTPRNIILNRITEKKNACSQFLVFGYKDIYI